MNDLLTSRQHLPSVILNAGATLACQPNLQFSSPSEGELTNATASIDLEVVAVSLEPTDSLVDHTWVLKSSD